MEVVNKVHYVGTAKDEYETCCNGLVKTVGVDNVYALIVTPCTYAHAVTEELRGVTVVVAKDTLVSRDLVRTTLETGTSEYVLTTMEDESTITREKLLENKYAFDSCVPDMCCEDSKFCIFEKSLYDWEPNLGSDWVDAIRVGRIYNNETSEYEWIMLVTSGLDYAAEELVEHAITNKWTMERFYNSEEYRHFKHACDINRDRVAYLAARSLQLKLYSSTYERTMTESNVHSLKSRFSSIHNTIVKRDLGVEGGGVAYAVHIETYPLHSYSRIPFIRGDRQMITILEPLSGRTARESWKNEYANSFPSGSGYKSHKHLRTIVEKWRPDNVHGDERCRKSWSSPIEYNLATMEEAYKRWSDVEPGLTKMGLSSHWKRTHVEVVLLKNASMNEDRLTAFELLQTYDRKSHLIRVPIRSNIFAGGNGYKSFWRVYTRQDERPDQVVHWGGMPMYVEVHRKYILRIAVTNGEVEPDFTFDDQVSYSSSSDADYESEYSTDDEDDIVL